MSNYNQTTKKSYRTKKRKKTLVIQTKLENYAKLFTNF